MNGSRPVVRAEVRVVFDAEPHRGKGQGDFRFRWYPALVMRALCLDLGAARTGVAISDPTGLLARPLEAIRGGLEAAALARTLEPILEEHEVEALIIGHPRRLSGETGPEAKAAEAMGAALEPLLGIPVHLWDERLSTVEARERLAAAGVRRRRRSRAQIDCLAATVILQSWLDDRRATAGSST